METDKIKWWRQRVANCYHWLVSAVYVAWYGYPARKLTVIGVTGTDGKTTTATLLYEILREAGLKAAMITTVGARIGNWEVDTGLHTTNPDARVMQPLISRMVKEGVTHLVLEVTAHGIDQYRVMGCNISIGVLTNVTHEHLDDFGTMERYRETKARMFKKVKWAVLNKDEENYKYFKKAAEAGGAKVVDYDMANLKNISPALAGDYNQYNLGAAVEAAKILGIGYEPIARVAASFAGVPGRRQEVKAGQKFRVVVDFAHTPNALEQILKQLKKEVPKNKKLIAVFGCTGERDKTKRPMMGDIAGRLADIVIITADDIRGDSQDEIYEQILAGVKKQDLKKIYKINDRRDALAKAFELAKTDDIVLLAGKGHEKTILIGKTELPWNDASEAAKLLQ